MRRRGDEQVDVPGADGEFVRLLSAPQADLDCVRIADRLAIDLDDAAERGLAAHGERDLGFRARRIAPACLHLRIGQPAANAEAVLRRGRAEMHAATRSQCRKWRTPVKTMARPFSSAAAITSASRIEPPGWTTAVAPASAAA